jgi:two-component system OmpR family sensor kinase
MTSLRARVLASVLLLAAAGMVALGAVTYAEQSSFLQGRVDQQARSAIDALSQRLDSAGFKPAGGVGGPDRGGFGSVGGGPAGHQPLVSLPPGTYGQRREASGKVIGHELIKYSESEAVPAAPSIPADVPLNTLITVGSQGSSGLQYRVFAQRDPEDSGITVAAVPLSEVDSTLDRLLLVEALVIGGVLIALGSSAFFVVRLGLRPLSRIEVTAGQIAAGDLSRRVSPATPKTEVGRLGLALNAMLERLEQAFAARTASEERLRQFLADASHELRTPLASIRGYAELFRMGATRDGAGTETAMRRIEEESARMGVLVEDLLTLARLDEQPDRDRAPVDLAELARDAVQDARARAPERAIELDSPGEAIVRGEEPQLRQVLTNLLGNALVHTPRGTPVEVVVSPAGDEVTVTVRDHGAGIPAEAREHLFERFWRREGGRERGKAGAGLGLAIVHGIVAAHHGRISAGQTSGGGAEFVVVLPVSAPERAPQPPEAADRRASS